MIGPETSSASTKLSQVETAAVTATPTTLASPIVSKLRLLWVSSPATISAVPQVTIGTVASSRRCSETRADSGGDAPGRLEPISSSSGRIASSSAR